MPQNRVLSKFLVEMIREPRSRAFKDLQVICWNDHTHSSDGDRLRGEVETELASLINGDAAPISTKLAGHTGKPLEIYPTTEKHKMIQDGFVPIKRLQIGTTDFYLATRQTGAAEELVYGVVRRVLENGEIQRLAVCKRCGRIFYRKSMKGAFCKDKCRYGHHNHSEKRKQHYIKGKWYSNP